MILTLFIWFSYGTIVGIILRNIKESFNMVTFFCNKLGRDKTVDFCRQTDIEVDCHIMDDQAYKEALLQKLDEEAQEVKSAQYHEMLEELADVQEVVDALVKVYGFTKEQLYETQIKKREHKGGFENKVYITSFTVAEDSPLKEYFLNQPAKYVIKK